MIWKQLQQIDQNSDVILRAQYANLRSQIPMMYALMFINSAFLGFVTYGEVSELLSLAVPAVLGMLIAVRAGLWLSRPSEAPSPAEIRRYLNGTLVASVLVSAAFGGWGFILLGEVGAFRDTAIALYVFVGSISCCYCLQAFPLAGCFVLFFGALPVTAKLLVSDSWYMAGIGVTFLLAAAIILQSLAKGYGAFKDVLQSRAEMGNLINALQQSEEHYRQSVALNPQIPWISDPTGWLIELSPRWAVLTGMSVDQGLGWGWTNAVHPDDLEHVRQLWGRVLARVGEEEADTRYRLLHANGTYRWFRARAFARLGERGEVISWYGSLEDIDDQLLAEQALQTSEERYRLASLATNDVIWDFAMGEDRVSWNAAAADVLTYPDIALGTGLAWFLERVHRDDRQRVVEQFDSVQQESLTHWSQEFRFLAGDGNYLDLAARSYAVRDDSGRVTRIIGSLRDITSQKHYESRLLWGAHHDALTGLPNRAFFTEHLAASLKVAVSTGSQVGLAVLDVDRFKTINDNFGHDAGDALLREIGDRLRRAAPESATVVRLGGDEFGIIFFDRDVQSADEGGIGELLASASAPVLFNGRQLVVGLSAGYAVAVEDGSTPEELHKSADLALYAAKAEGFASVHRFQPALRAAAERETQMLHDARQALHKNLIVPFYQPKVCLKTGECTGFEALLRWHNGQGLRSPAGIAAAFNDPALAVQLTDRMLDCVISDIMSWRHQGVTVGPVAINGSAADFRRGDFSDRLLSRLDRACLPPSAIELEVTESVFLEEMGETVLRTLDILADAGVSISLDDFGTGYASLTHLKQFPVDTIKIDRSFISQMDNDGREDEAIVRAILHLARSLGIKTIAEGVETASQAARLAQKSCDEGQGFLFGRPMAAAQIADTIVQWDKDANLATIRSGTEKISRRSA